MVEFPNVPQRDFAQAIARYWHAYGRHVEKPPGRAKSWKRLAPKTQVLLGEAVVRLITSAALMDGLQADRQLLGSEKPAFKSDKPLDIKWGAVPVRIYPWVDLKAQGAKYAAEFIRSLEPQRLSMIIVPHPLAQDPLVEGVCKLVLEARTNGCNVVLVAPDDVDAIASGGWTISELLSYKLFKIFLEGGTDADAVFGPWQIDKFRADTRHMAKSDELEPIEKALIARKSDINTLVNHPKHPDIARLVLHQPFVLLSGPSASGKSLLALSLAHERSMAGDSVWFVDIGSLTSEKAFRIGFNIFRKCLSDESNIVILLDDLHTQPDVANQILLFLRLIQTTLRPHSLKVLGICWPHYKQDVLKIRPDARAFDVEAADIRERLIETFGKGIAPSTKETIRQSAGKDLLILRLWLEMAKDGESVSNLVELGQEIWEQRSQRLKGDRKPFLRAMFIAAILGQFECDVTGSFLVAQASVSEQHLTELARAKLLIPEGRQVFIATSLIC